LTFNLAEHSCSWLLTWLNFLFSLIWTPVACNTVLNFYGLKFNDHYTVDGSYLTSSWALHTIKLVCDPLKDQTELFTKWLDYSWSYNLNLAERSTRVTAQLEYLDHVMIICSWFLQYNSVVFDPISSQPLKTYSTLSSAHTSQVSAYSIKFKVTNLDYIRVTHGWRFCHNSITIISISTVITPSSDRFSSDYFKWFTL